MATVNLFVVGAAKADTTSFYSYLNQHPDIYMSPIKEPHFFSTDIRKENFTQKNYTGSILDTAKYFSTRPLSPQHIAFIDNPDEYNALFEGAGLSRILGETSTGYLYSSTAASNIARYNSAAKIVMILREPVDRAFSHWKMNLASGSADAGKPFMETILDDYASSPKGWGISNLYIDLGMYYEQIKRYYDHFPEQKIKIMRFDQLMQNPEQFMADIYDFLGIANNTIDTSKKENISALPRFPFVNRINKKLGLSAWLPQNIKQQLKGAMSKTTFPSYSADDKSCMYDLYFSRQINETEKLTGMDFKSWAP